jgi:hypothetical protein
MDAFSASDKQYKTNIMKGILAVAYLLEMLGEGGLGELGPCTAEGFADILRHCAGDIDRYLTEGYRLHELEYQLKKARESAGE